MLVLFIIYAGASLFNGLLCLVGAVALHEFYTMGFAGGRKLESGLAIAAGVMLTAGILFGDSWRVAQAALVFAVFGLCLLYLFRYREMGRVGHDLAITLFGLLYVPLLLSHAGLLRSLPLGREWIFMVLCIVMASDTLAYFVGMRWGRHRLYEAVSPKKSVEGALGGLAGGLLGVSIVKFWFLPLLQTVDIIVLGVGVGACSQLGDLVESLLKRSFGVKDSGNLIPGHGGLLDRLDSLLFAFPLTYYYVVWCLA